MPSIKWSYSSHHVGDPSDTQCLLFTAEPLTPQS
ncbi:mCG1030131 [Mus musculus]|nr:mCG1030131 [Mus musculus]